MLIARSWEYDGGSWREVIATDPEGDGDPVGRWFHALTYDSARGVTILFGGLNAGVWFSNTWEYDGVSWREVTPIDPEGDSSPVGRFAHAMAYDTARGVTILFGGFDGSSHLSDTWAYDGVSWREVTPTMGIPGRRC